MTLLVVCLMDVEAHRDLGSKKRNGPSARIADTAVTRVYAPVPRKLNYTGRPL